MSGNDQCQMCHIYFPQVYFFNMHSTIRRNENIVLKKCAEVLLCENCPNTWRVNLRIQFRY